MKGKLLIIGGTGIVGKAIIREALRKGYEITVVGLDMDNSISYRVKQIKINRKNDKEFRKLCNSGLNIKWDIVVDVFEFDKESARQTYECFKDSANHIFILSTVLVYDRSKPYDLPIKSSHNLSQKSLLGGYVDHKLDIEEFWHNVNDANWTILRPYHILGVTDSLLGCIPDHNRDPKLLDRIKKGEPLTLCEGGDIKFNFINPTDIANIIFKSYNNSKTFHKAYNAVNPEIIFAKEYYELIGKEIGKKPIIKDKSIQQVWKENKGWQLTTLPNIYDMNDLKGDIGFVPNISLKETIKNVIKSYKPINRLVSEIPVHQRMTLLPRPKPIRWLLNSPTPE